MNLKKIIWFVLAISIFACGKNSNQGAKKPEKIRVKTIQPLEMTVEEKISALGNVIASKEVSITAEITGKVIEIKKQEGDWVKAGDLLFVINQEPFELSVKKAQAALEQSLSNLAYAENTFKDSLLSIEKKFHEIEKSRIQLMQTKLELEETERDFKNKEILYKKEGLSKTAFKKLELQHQEAKAKYELAQRNFESESIGFREKDLMDAFGSVPEKKEEKIEKIKELRTRMEKAKLEIARSEYSKVKIDLEEAQLLLSKCRVYSPINAVVGVKKINEGEMIQKDSPLFILFHTEKIYGEFEISEENIGKISRKNKVVFKSDAFSEKEFKGTVEIINPLISQKTRTGIVRVEAANPKGELRVGMFIRGTFYPNQQRQVLTLPEKCLASLKGDRGEVFLMKQNYAVKKSVLVETEKLNSLYVIREGLDKNDLVVQESSSELMEGSEVILE